MTEISKEYAQALFELACEQGAEKEYFNALELIAAELEQTPEYTTLLSAPDIPLDTRKELIADAFGGRVPPHVLSFLQLLCQQGRIRELKNCVPAYGELYKALESISTAQVISAVPLTDDQKKALVIKLEKISGHRVSATYEIDETLLGGLTVYMDDKVFDGSLRRRLKEIKEVMEP